MMIKKSKFKHINTFISEFIVLFAMRNAHFFKDIGVYFGAEEEDGR